MWSANQTTDKSQLKRLYFSMHQSRISRLSSSFSVEHPFIQKTTMLFPPLPPNVHSLLCGFCDSLGASRAWWNRRRSKSSSDEADAASTITCAGQDSDIRQETIAYYDNPALGLTMYRRNSHEPLARRVTHVGPRGTFIVDGRNLSHAFFANDPLLTPIENELLQLTGNPQAPFDDDGTLPSLESV